MWVLARTVGTRELTASNAPRALGFVMGERWILGWDVDKCVGISPLTSPTLVGLFVSTRVRGQESERRERQWWSYLNTWI